MDPLKLEIHFVVDHGAIIALFGVDQATGSAVTIHIDKRPWSEVRQDLRVHGPAKATYEADAIALNLVFDTPAFPCPVGSA